MTSFSETSCAQLFLKNVHSGCPNYHQYAEHRRLRPRYSADPIGAVRIPSKDSEHTAKTPREKSGDPYVGKTVVGCQHGHKVSHGAAAFLRTPGVAAEVLSGGLCA